MKIIDIFLVSIYLHFCSMQEKGRNVVPWFQTAFSISLFGDISSALIFKIIIKDNLKHYGISEMFFLIAFLLLGIGYFFLVKIFFFNDGMHLALSKMYIETYTNRKILFFKIVSISIMMLIPLFLGTIVWIEAV